MLSEKTVRDAFNTLALASKQVREGSEMYIHLISQTAVLGWVLDEGVYVENMEAILKECRKVVGNPVQG